VAKILVFGLIIGASIGVQAAQLPILPQEYLDTTYSQPSGATIVVNGGGDLQAAINNASPGDTIVLEAGASFVGPFTLPQKTGSDWIYIQSSAMSSLPPPGTRVSPADANNMPKIISPGNSTAIQTAARAHHYRFVGIEFRPAAGQFVYGLVTIGNNESSLADLPSDITFDRCFVHGDPGVGGRRGIALNGARSAVIDSYVSDFKEGGADTQAVWTYNSPGPIKIVNNYLEAAGENFMSGGADPAVPNLVPADLEIRRNYFFKPTAWMNQGWSVKNLLELKNAERVLIEGNLFENNWPASQNGLSILITPRNQDGNAPWSVTKDVTFRFNRLVNLGQGFNISGSDGTYPSQRTERILIEHNLIDVTSLGGAQGRIFQFLAGPIDVTVAHNTAFTTSGGALAFSENNPPANRFDFRDNIVSNGAYGFAGTGSGSGDGTLNQYFTDASFQNNVVIGGSSSAFSSPYTPNYFPLSTSLVGFVNAVAGNFRLGSVSLYKGVGTNGSDPGADMDAIDAASSSDAPLSGPGSKAPLAPTALNVL
jgi:hypothetical protein